MVLFRGMRPDPQDNLPLVADTGSGLGVRSGPPPSDIPVSDDGYVVPETGGMSVVASDPYLLPGHRKPQSMNGTGKGHHVFSLDEADLPRALTARQDQPVNNPAHRLIEPTARCTFNAFHDDIVSTRAKWRTCHV